MKYFLHVFFLLLILSNTYTQAQWSRTNGPWGGYAFCLEQTSTALLAGTADGIYSSVNQGQTWQRTNFVNGICSDILYFNDTLIVAYSVPSEDTTLSITSFDNGITWSSPSFISVSSFTTRNKLHHSGNNIIIESNYKYYISIDFGTTWFTMPIPYGVSIYYIDFSENYLLMSALDSTLTHFGHLICDQGTLNWNLIDTTYLSSRAIIVDSVILIDHSDSLQNYIVRSNDLGLSWDTVVTLPLTSLQIFKDQNDSIYYFDNSMNFYLSADLGLTWAPSPVAHGWHYHDPIQLNNGNEISIFENTGIVRYTHSLGTHIPSYTGISAHHTTLISEMNSNLYCATTLGMFKSINSGVMWQQVQIPLTSYEFESLNVRSSEHSGDTLLFFTEKNTIRSVDNGTTWDTLSAPFEHSIDIFSTARIGNRIYRSTLNNHYTDDFGQSWTLLPDLPSVTPCVPISSDATGTFCVANGELFSVTNSGSVFHLDLSNNTWVYDTCYFSAGAYNGNVMFQLDTVLVTVIQHRMLISYDYGSTWIESPANGLPLDEFGEIKIPRRLIYQNNMWIGSCGISGIYASADQGNNWGPFFSGNSPFFCTGGITTLNNELFAGSYSAGVWKRDAVHHSFNGTVYSDFNQNGTQDFGENGIPGISLNLGTSSSITYTDNSGNFVLFSDAQGDTLRPVLHQFYQSANPGYYIIDTLSSSPFMFGIQMPSSLSDLSIDLNTTHTFRPGFQSNLNVQVDNHGFLRQPSEVMMIADTGVVFISANPAPDLIIGDTLYWTLDSLSFGDQSRIRITFLAPTTLQQGDLLNFSAVIIPTQPDTFPSDNQIAIVVMVRNSIDPNDKQCSEEDHISLADVVAGKEIEYTIRFQNTGTAPAINIHITDTLSPYLDWSSFRVISSSSPVRTTLASGVADFHFDNIQLPDSNLNEPLSHGYVKYGMNCNTDCTSGNVIDNTATIFFDFNPGIRTNTVTTSIIDSIVLAVHPMIFDPTIKVVVFPNPASDKLFIRLLNGSQSDKELRITNMLGQNMRTELIQANETSINIEALNPGIYIGTIISQDAILLASFRFIHK